MAGFLQTVVSPPTWDDLEYNPQAREPVRLEAPDAIEDQHNVQESRAWVSQQIDSMSQNLSSFLRMPDLSPPEEPKEPVEPLPAPETRRTHTSPPRTAAERKAARRAPITPAPGPYKSPTVKEEVPLGFRDHGRPESPPEAAPAPAAKLPPPKTDKKEDTGPVMVNASHKPAVAGVDYAFAMLPAPKTRHPRHEIKRTVANDDIDGVQHWGHDEAAEYHSHTHLYQETLDMLTRKEKMERDFRSAHNNIAARAAKDLADDNKRLRAIEGAFEIGRETLTDYNV